MEEATPYTSSTVQDCNLRLRNIRDVPEHVDFVIEHLSDPNLVLPRHSPIVSVIEKNTIKRYTILKTISFAFSEGMLLFMLLALALLPWNGVLGGQIPVVDGVLGGVKSSAAKSPQLLQTATLPAPAPGKLRVVENSGICGTFTRLLKASVCLMTHYFRDNPRCLSSLGLW